MLVLLPDTTRRKQGNGASGKDSSREHLLPYCGIISAGAPGRNPYLRTVQATAHGALKKPRRAKAGAATHRQGGERGAFGERPPEGPASKISSRRNARYNDHERLLRSAAHQC